MVEAFQRETLEEKNVILFYRLIFFVCSICFCNQYQNIPSRTCGLAYINFHMSLPLWCHHMLRRCAFKWLMNTTLVLVLGCAVLVDTGSLGIFRARLWKSWWQCLIAQLLIASIEMVKSYQQHFITCLLMGIVTVKLLFLDVRNLCNFFKIWLLNEYVWFLFMRF